MFIIDQHASDEKYNFEELTRTTKITQQQLLHPRRLELTVSDEMTAVEHQQIFQSNGFAFQYNDDHRPGNRIELLTMPVFHGISFNLTDFQELLHHLVEYGPNINVQCNKIRSILASKACRKSWMIGTALSYRDMKKIVENLSYLDQPWNCPHGRPTMRWLLRKNV